MSVTSTLNQGAGWACGFDWTDQTGLPSEELLFPTLNNGPEYQTINSQVFTVQPGTPIVVSVGPTNPPPQDASYEVDFTIEKLVKTD